MRKRFLFPGPLLLAVFAASGLAACGSEDTTPEGDPTPPGDEVEVPEFPEQSGQAPNPELPYPAGPYGVSTGSVIHNYRFVGFAQPHQGMDAGMQYVQLADFYNPTGDESFPEGSLYAGPKPKALLLIVSAVWCAPCNAEAKSILPPKYAKYKPMGAEFLLNLADGPKPGEPAEPKHLVRWNTKYKVDFPAFIDPSYKLGALFEQDAFPANIVVDTRTMQIRNVISGAPTPGFWSKFEKVLHGE